MDKELRGFLIAGVICVALVLTFLTACNIAGQNYQVKRGQWLLEMAKEGLICDNSGSCIPFKK